ncbi:MAG: helix-turn-helix transcriptional regulator [Clostridium sp.]
MNNEERYIGLTKRLHDYRIDNGYTTKTNFSKWLDMSRNIYTMIENGYRDPNKAFLDKIVTKTGLSEAYWLYGVTSDIELSEARNEFKSVRSAIDDILELELITLDGEYTSEKNMDIAKSLLDVALKADMYHILYKKRQEKKQD